MRYNPETLPFWEVSNGGGPLTERKGAHDRAQKLIAMRSLRDELEIAKGRVVDSKISQGRQDALARTVAARRYEHVLERYNAVRAELSMPKRPKREPRERTNDSGEWHSLNGHGHDGNGNNRILPRFAAT